jgi:ATP phosphoribosyltransferase
MYKIGFPKGNIKNKSLSAISRIVGHEIDREQLNFSNGKDCEAYLLKHRDIPLLLQQGRLDYAVASTEWLKERGATFPVLRELGWSQYKICLIGSPEKPIDQEKGPETCVTEYPTIAKEYLKEKGWTQTLLYVVSGSSEGFVPSIYDCCIDCVETGSTLKRQGLVVFDTILTTNTVLVGRDENLQPDQTLLSAIGAA